MKKFSLIFIVLAILIGSTQLNIAAREQDDTKAVPNLSFPVVATDFIDVFYQKEFIDEDGDGEWDEGEKWTFKLDEDGMPIPLQVTEVISDTYDGSYAGNEDAYHYSYTVDPVTGCAVDVTGDGEIDDSDRTEIPMEEWLTDMIPWYDQPVYIQEDYAWNPNNIWNADYVDTSEIGGANSWQADWKLAEEVIYIDFVDWGNPLENINPRVGQRFPVEVALYKQIADWEDNVGLSDTSMTAFKMACLEYPGTLVELFGTSVVSSTSYTYESAFATVLTNRFSAWVEDPNGQEVEIPISPGIGPSGKMNFASASGGWIPEMGGWHTIWFRVLDPLISLENAIVNNDEHYIMTSGCMTQELNPNKLELTGIWYNDTYIEVCVEPHSDCGGGG